MRWRRHAIAEIGIAFDVFEDAPLAVGDAVVAQARGSFTLGVEWGARASLDAWLERILTAGATVRSRSATEIVVEHPGTYYSTPGPRLVRARELTHRGMPVLVTFERPQGEGQEEETQFFESIRAERVIGGG